jgi:hypothetical protein
MVLWEKISELPCLVDVHKTHTPMRIIDFGSIFFTSSSHTEETEHNNFWTHTHSSLSLSLSLSHTHHTAKKNETMVIKSCSPAHIFKHQINEIFLILCGEALEVLVQLYREKCDRLRSSEFPSARRTHSAPRNVWDATGKIHLSKTKMHPTFNQARPSRPPCQLSHNQQERAREGRGSAT